MTGYLFIVIGAVLVNNVVFGRILGLCLAIASEAEARTLRPNTFGIARL